VMIEAWADKRRVLYCPVTKNEFYVLLTCLVRDTAAATSPIDPDIWGQSFPTLRHFSYSANYGAKAREHPELFKELDYRAYRVETASYHSKQHAPIRPHKEDSLYRRNLPEGSQPEALYYWVFPNLMLNLYPDNLQTNIIIPLGPERTLTRFEWYVLEPNSPGVAEEFARSFAFSDQVQQEDIGICEAVQKGLRSRTFDHGRYSVLRENGVHHFHGLVAEFLNRP